MSDAPTRTPSSLRASSVAEVLRSVQQEVSKTMLEKLRERVAKGFLTAPEEELQAIANTAGFEARCACGNAVGEAFQMGVNSKTRPEEYERDTERPKR